MALCFAGCTKYQARRQVLPSEPLAIVADSGFVEVPGVVYDTQPIQYYGTQWFELIPHWEGPMPPVTMEPPTEVIPDEVPPPAVPTGEALPPPFPEGARQSMPMAHPVEVADTVPNRQPNAAPQQQNLAPTHTPQDPGMLRLPLTQSFPLQPPPGQSVDVGGGLTQLVEQQQSDEAKLNAYIQRGSPVVRGPILAPRGEQEESVVEVMPSTATGDARVIIVPPAMEVQPVISSIQPSSAGPINDAPPLTPPEQNRRRGIQPVIQAVVPKATARAPQRTSEPREATNVEFRQPVSSSRFPERPNFRAQEPALAENPGDFVNLDFHELVRESSVPASETSISRPSLESSGSVPREKPRVEVEKDENGARWATPRRSVRGRGSRRKEVKHDPHVSPVQWLLQEQSRRNDEARGQSPARNIFTPRGMPANLPTGELHRHQPLPQAAQP